MLAPVIIFVYNRPEHTKETIKALAENCLAKETDVYIFSDAPKNELGNENVKLTRKYIDSISGENYFKKVEIRKSDINKGLANSVIDGVSEIVERYGRVIVLEDDIVCSTDFLEYMNNALNYYEKDNSIWSISGFNIPIKIPKDYKDDIYLSYRACSWGWATWENRWKQVDWKVSDYNKFKNNNKLRKKFERGGRDMAYMLDNQMKGKLDSWAIRWCYSQSKANMYTVYPVISKVKNIGLDGSGTHSGVSSKYNSEFNNNSYIEFKTLDLNKKIVKRFKNHYMSAIGYYLRKIKRILSEESI